MMEQEIDGKIHVVVPKEMWEKMWKIFDRIDQLGIDINSCSQFERQEAGK